MEGVGRATWTVVPRGQWRESWETNEFNLLLFLSRKYLEMSPVRLAALAQGRLSISGSAAVKWMQRHVAARHDKGLVLSLVTRHFSLLLDGAAVDLGHHCRVVASGLVPARAAFPAF
jgi:hypothetical protein